MLITWTHFTQTSQSNRLHINPINMAMVLYTEITFYKNIKRESHAEKNFTGGNRQRTERLWW